MCQVRLITVIDTANKFQFMRHFALPGKNAVFQPPIENFQIRSKPCVTYSVRFSIMAMNNQSTMTGLKITAGQLTMFSLIADLTSQTLILPVILISHFWIRTFYFPYSCCLILYNAVIIYFSLAFFAALH